MYEQLNKQRDQHHHDAQGQTQENANEDGPKQISQKSTVGPGQILQLQRTHGNRFVQRMIVSRIVQRQAAATTKIGIDPDDVEVYGGMITIPVSMLTAEGFDPKDAYTIEIISNKGPRNPMGTSLGSESLSITLLPEERVSYVWVKQGAGPQSGAQGGNSGSTNAGTGGGSGATASAGGQSGASSGGKTANAGQNSSATSSIPDEIKQDEQKYREFLLEHIDSMNKALLQHPTANKKLLASKDINTLVDIYSALDDLKNEKIEAKAARAKIDEAL